MYLPNSLHYPKKAELPPPELCLSACTDDQQHSLKEATIKSQRKCGKMSDYVEKDDEAA